jgi:hypothetical protein
MQYKPYYGAVQYKLQTKYYRLGLVFLQTPLYDAACSQGEHSASSIVARQRVLTYHVVLGRLMAAEVMKMDSVETLALR